MPLQLLKSSGEKCANFSSQRWGTRPFRGVRHAHISLFSAEYTVSTTGVSQKVGFSCKYLEVTQSTFEERLDLEINFLTAARYFAHCEGIDIVQSDHAPEAGVAQGIIHGVLIRHQGGHQEELEEELEEEVERRVEREHSSNQTQVRMHG